MRRFDWREYFLLSKKERNAAVAIVLIVAGFTAASFYFTPSKPKPLSVSFVSRLDDSLQTLENKKTFRKTQPKYHGNVATINQTKLFVFDPNTLSKVGWEQLGVPTKNIKTVLNYLGKGGHFYKAEDIFKIYGLSKANATALLPYIQIATGQKEYKNKVKTVYQPTYHQNIVPIDINTATVQEWKSLPGIGDVLSNRIVKFRAAIGGFKSINDIKKTYGLSDSTFGIIQKYLIFSNDNDMAKEAIINDAKAPALGLKPQKININTATEQEMKEAHFLSMSIIKAIIIYRHQHKGFKSVEELKKIPFISEEKYQNIASRLVVE